jgi:mRNA-degrading endonuclease YafQ of YafQ-DinJ toxin-antitoxin module
VARARRAIENAPSLDADLHVALAALLADLPLKHRYFDHAMIGNWAD